MTLSSTEVTYNNVLPMMQSYSGQRRLNYNVITGFDKLIVDKDYVVEVEAEVLKQMVIL